MTRYFEDSRSSSLSYEGIEGRPGVEPGPAGPHPAVLPLNYRPTQNGGELRVWPVVVAFEPTPPFPASRPLDVSLAVLIHPQLKA